MSYLNGFVKTRINKLVCERRLTGEVASVLVSHVEIGGSGPIHPAVELYIWLLPRLAHPL